jgi:hypothetical protein
MHFKVMWQVQVLEMSLRFQTNENIFVSDYR